MSMAKRVGDLEASFWTKAEIIRLPVVDETLDYLKTVEPLDTMVFSAWENDYTQGAKIAHRIRQIEKALPPTHPAFLPDEAEAYRVYQWALYHRADYRRLIEQQWARFLVYARSRYDVNDDGLLGVALRLYEKDIQRWTAQRDYIGRPANPEIMAREMLELWTVFRRKCSEADEPEDQKTRDALWRQAAIETELKLYGRQISEADYDLDGQQWAQLQKDMAAGLASGESEAVAYFRDVSDRYPFIG